MQLRVYDIIPELQPYVKVISSVAHEASDISFFRVLPDTCAELFFNYTTGPAATVNKTVLQRSFVNCRTKRFTDVAAVPGTGFITVCFRPGAACHFFPLPMSELTNITIELTEILNSGIKEIEEKVNEATHNEQRVAVIQQYLYQLLSRNYKQNDEFEYCLWQINLLRGQARIKELSKKINVTQRQLSRQFNNFIGLPPKEFARVNRFIHSLTHLKTFPQNSLTEIAYESGYYDQGHYIHECREFSGLAPRELATCKYTLF